MTTESINITFLGIDDRSKSAYEIFFKGIRHFKCQLVDDVNQAQLCLVDNDAYDIQGAYDAQVEAHPQLYTLVLSLNDYHCSRDQEFFIRKPVKRDQMEHLLNRIYHLLIGRPLPKSLQARVEATVINTAPKAAEKNTPLTAAQPKPETPDPGGKSDSEQKVVSFRDSQKQASAVNAAMMLKVENEEYFVGEQTDIDLDNPQELEKIYYQPTNMLQAIVEKAIMLSSKEQRIVQLDVLNNTFYFDFEEQKVYSTVGPGIIRPLCLVRHDKNIAFTTRANSYRNQLHEIMQSNKHQSAKKTLEKQSWNMESFMWLITLWSSRGRIPHGTDVKQPAYLLQWPNLTRLASIPHALRIAALLRDRNCSLADMARHLNIEQRYVFAFYSACKAIGLANISKRRADKLFVSEKPQKSKNQSILAKLLTRLVSFSDKSSMNEIA